MWEQLIPWLVIAGLLVTAVVTVATIAQKAATTDPWATGKGGDYYRELARMQGWDSDSGGCAGGCGGGCGGG
ncbi:hypothetical protein [Mycolicibacterium sp.]|uniref:hypothetical protein n=1 Tax=Mycolicibacterium sp. TaxID=2320850 RepID=UPI003D0A120F